MEKYHGAVEQIIALILGYVPKVVGAILVWVVGSWVISRLLNIVSKAMEARNLEVSLRTFLKSLISVGLKVLLVFSIAGMLGFETTSFVTVLGAAGLAIGLALQGSLSNFAGGVLILIFKPFKVGDTIEAQGRIGKVTEIQIFNTLLLTGDHKVVIIPNGPLSNGTMVNISRAGTLVFDIRVDIDNKHDFETVKSVIMPILEYDDRIEAPKINIVKLGYATTIAILGTTTTANQGNVVNELNIKIRKALQYHIAKTPDAVNSFM